MMEGEGPFESKVSCILTIEFLYQCVDAGGMNNSCSLDYHHITRICTADVNTYCQLISQVADFETENLAVWFEHPNLQRKRLEKKNSSADSLPLADSYLIVYQWIFSSFERCRRRMNSVRMN